MIDRAVLAQLLTTLVAFILFFWIAKKMFWTSIMRTIEERQARIRGEFDKIDSMQKQVDSLQADYQRRIADIEVEARAKMQEAVAQGKIMAEQIGDQARRDAEAQAEKSRNMIQLEMDKARLQLKEEVVKMTLAATEKLIRQSMNDNQQRKLVNDFVEELSRR